MGPASQTSPTSPTRPTGRTCGSRLRGVVAALMVASLPGLADVVQTPGDRIEGQVAFADGALQVAGKPVAWGDVLFVIRASDTRSIRPPEALRMASGEVWLCNVASLTAGRLKVRLPLVGERELDVAALRALDFLPALPPPEAADKPGTLYRVKGEPVPGRLMWVDEQRVAIDSPLGVLTLSREGLARYLFRSGPKPSPGTEDEVSLVDGSVLRGKATPGKGVLELEHAVLGRIPVPDRLLRSVLRRPASVVYVAEQAPARVDAVPLVARGVPPEVLEYVTQGDSRAWPGELVAIRGIRIEPKCSASWRVPRVQGPRLTLRATLAPIEGMRGDVKLRLVAAGKTLLEREIGPASKREAVAVEVPPDAELAVEVDFGPLMRFPCGVLIGDPVVVGQ